MDKNKIPAIYGSKGGKGGGGSGASEAANTVKSKTLIRVLEVISEGECQGLVDGAKGIYFNDTPLQNSDGTYNFSNVVWDQRVGLPTQPYMEGFPSAQAEYGVSTNVSYASPVIYTVTSPIIDAARVTLLFTQGLTEQDLKSGNLNGSSVEIAFDVKTSSGVWTQVASTIVKEKTTSQYEVAFRLPRPTQAGIWSLRVRRVSQDPTGSNIKNQFQLARVVEIQDVKLEYPNTAYVGIAVDAESVGNSIPKRAYLYKGVKCKVPTNYDPLTATYSGIWNGLFKTAWTDNPAWHLYDLILNPRYGLGDVVQEDELDKYSFYDAAVYNDELVPDGHGGMERRFTFNTVLAAQEEAVKTIQALAGSFRATLIKEGHLFRLNQDRPSDPVRLVTNANVIDGAFNYVSTALQDRHTIARVTYNDKTDRYLRATTTVEGDPALIERYGWNVAELNCYGATTEGQAIRHGKWLIDTETSQLQLASWQSSFNQMDLRIGDVVKLFDENYAGVVVSGRFNSVASNGGGYTLTLDRSIAITQATGKIEWNDSLGAIGSASFTSSVGTTNTIAVTSIMGAAPTAGSEFVVTQAVSPRLFRITRTSYDGESPNIINVEALEYDPTKYARIEQGITSTPPVYTNINLRDIPEVTNIQFRVISKVTDEGVRRSLLVSWTPPYSPILGHYSVQWKKDNGPSTQLSNIYSASVEIDNITDGTYDVAVICHTVNGTQSLGARASYVYSLVGGSGSVLLQPTNLQTTDTLSSNFATPHLSIQWTHPLGNASISDAQLKDFVLSIRDVSDNLVRTEYITAVDVGATQTYLYSFEQNKADGGPRRQLKVSVAARDTHNLLTNATTVTFTNAQPVAPTLTVKAGVKSLMVEASLDTSSDHVGTIFYGSTTSGFTPNDSNIIYKGPNSFYIVEGVSTSMYFRAAHYDTFGTTGLSYSSEASGTPGSAAGITSVTSIPANPTAIGGQTVFYLDVSDPNTRGLYAWDGSAWKYTRDGQNLIANSVTADKITVANLAALSANLGSVTSGSLTIDQAGFVRGGATGFNAGTGFWQGYDSGNYKWRVGTPGSSRAEWNGSSFNIYDGSGNLTISSGVVDYSKLTNKPSSLSSINSTEAAKLSSVQYGATNVTNTNQLTDGAGLGSTALWSNVSGAGKPENNATLGATIGTNLSGQFTASNIGTYIQSAAIGSALIADAAITNAKIGTAEINTLKIAGESVTVSRSAYTGSTYVTSAGGWFDLQYVTIDSGNGTVTCIGSANLTTNYPNNGESTFRLRLISPSGSVLSFVSSGDTGSTSPVFYAGLTVCGVSTESGQYKLQGWCAPTVYTATMSERFLLCLATKR